MTARFNLKIDMDRPHAENWNHHCLSRSYGVRRSCGHQSALNAHIAAMMLAFHFIAYQQPIRLTQTAADIFHETP